MTMRDWNRQPVMRVALGALVVAIGLTLWSLVRAFRGDEIPPAAPITIASLDKAGGATSRVPADVDAAVENDLFSSDRSAPATAYRMPDEDAPDAAPVAEPEKPTVLGTAVATDGRHFATVQLTNASPKLVHVGDTVGTWIVRSIGRGKVGFVSTDGIHVDVTVPKPGN